MLTGRNLDNQVRMAPATLAQLADLGASPQSELKLEFFFYTNSPTRPPRLAADLVHLGYQTHHGLAAEAKGQSVVTGWTTPMAMAEELVVAWTRRMCELGFEHDCEFDGWGTTPEQ